MGLFSKKPKDEQLILRLEKLNQQIDSKKQELGELAKNIKLMDKQISLTEQIENKKAELDSINKQISLSNDELSMQELGFFKRQYKFSDSTKYKDALNDIRLNEKNLVKAGRAGIVTSPMTLDNSLSKGKAMQNALIRAAIRGFNGEADALLTKISASNVSQKISALIKSFEQLNKMYSRNLIRISSEYLELKKQELQLAAEFELKKQEEKDILREQKEREREDKKLQAEIKRQQAKYDKDITQFTNAIEIAENRLNNASESEIKELKKQIAEYKRKIASLNEDKEELDTKFSNAKAGYVYVISNVGSFGEGIVKIGVTRRLTPTDRVDELGSASVPFKFSINAIIFNDDAFDLETRLHQYFDKFRVNKFNNRKEYFKVDLNKIKEYLSNDSSLNVEWNETPENFEYEQTLLIENK
ncbi:DUF4041 domain-containing protein [Lactococcus protaetiae]|uniref:DUF4041 domain-containing protein n=1 Tax=Lactococcus protaetiae TaxID=2592653 RepID=A0A514ZA87_9LACT|nr:DUF4041 domain-containing protein [Lactococcus protaetiae]QDK71493.1 DUF4041 domain-containing protein [Lactococcus protaetiae]